MTFCARLVRNLATIFLTAMLCWGCGVGEPQMEMNAWSNSGTNTEIYTQVDGTHELSFPIDHGSHDDYMIEWWYLTALLDDQKGREFGIQFTIFRRALTLTSDPANPWRSGQIYMAHFAMSDVQEQTHWTDERFSRGHPELAGARADPFRVNVDDWTLASTDKSFFPLKLSANTPEYSASLAISTGKPMVLQGINGYSQKSPEHASYYYTYSRLPASGQIKVKGKEYDVLGTAWLDREWSSQILSLPYIGWYWFSLVFDDNRELVLFELQSEDVDVKTLPTANWIEPDGTSKSIPASNWKIKPRRFWKSYPVEWELEVDKNRYVVAAKFDNQVMNTSIKYWEGVVEVKDGENVIGRGYMELTGYE